MDFTDLMEVFKEALGELSGDEITTMFNKVVDRQVEYKGDSVWEFTGEKTTDEPKKKQE